MAWRSTRKRRSQARSYRKRLAPRPRLAPVAFRGPLHPPDADHRCTVHGMCPNPTGARRPRARIDAEVERRHSGEDREHAIHWAEMTAPDALAFSINEADRDGGERRAAKHEKRRCCVLVHAHELAEDRR